MPEICRDDFFTRMGPSVPEILGGDFSPKWVHLYRRYLRVIFASKSDHLCLRFFRCDFSTQVRPSVPRYFCFKGDFFTQVGPFVPGAICARDLNRGDFLYPVAWDHLCPKRKILPGSNYYCGEVILPTCCCFPPFLICLLLSIYIFISLLLFCLLVGSFSFLFQMCSSQKCAANSLSYSLIICSLKLAASRKQCLHQKRKAPFVLV